MWTRSLGLAAIAIVLVVVGCGGGSECKVADVQYTKSLNAVGYAGATQGVMQVATSKPQNQTFKPGGDDQDQYHHQQ